MSARPWLPDGSRAWSLREFNMRARVARVCSLPGADWRWEVTDTVPRTDGGGVKYFLELASGRMPRRRDAKAVAEAVIDAVGLIEIDDGIAVGRRKR